MRTRFPTRAVPQFSLGAMLWFSAGCAACLAAFLATTLPAALLAWVVLGVFYLKQRHLAAATIHLTGPICSVCFAALLLTMGLALWEPTDRLASGCGEVVGSFLSTGFFISGLTSFAVSLLARLVCCLDDWH